MEQVHHKVDFCVVGGGLAGICAAVSAARRGIKVVLMHDRPVLGGNASSEIRMWTCGAIGLDTRETGIIEEIHLENQYRNPLSNYHIWDSILYEKVRFEPNITLLLNCSCNNLEMNGNSIESVTGWQLTTQQWHTVKATLYADCSGDSILTPLSGAEFTTGRESQQQFDEQFAPKKADKSSMGMSCLFQARQTNSPQKFTPPAWAYRYHSEKELPLLSRNFTHTNYWWIEVGGTYPDITSKTEQCRDELLKIIFGVWDYIKNSGKFDSEQWALDWIGFLPGKRESRRYVGDHILTQNDISSAGKFEDIVAYGRWKMDVHFPEGFQGKKEGTTFYETPSPFGIPYRCLYSKNITNLFFAGRNISATHLALSASRVMQTCAIMGQAVGLAAVLATQKKLCPRDICGHIEELKQLIMDDDCYLPWNKRKMPKLTEKAQLRDNGHAVEVLRNGVDRSLGDQDNGIYLDMGEQIQYRFEQPEHLSSVRIIFDSDLRRKRREETPWHIQMTDMLAHYPADQSSIAVSEKMTRSFIVEGQRPDQKWELIHKEENNYQRLFKTETCGKYLAVRFIPHETWGAENCHLFSFSVA